jgi:hypothetical protein
MRKSDIEAKIAGKLAAIQADILAWALAEGIAKHADQVPVTLKYIARPLRFSTKLTNNDWTKVFSHRWTEEERSLLKSLQGGAVLDRGRFDPLVERVNVQFSLAKTKFRLRTKGNTKGRADVWIAKRLN